MTFEYLATNIRKRLDEVLHERLKLLTMIVESSHCQSVCRCVTVTAVARTYSIIMTVLQHTAITQAAAHVNPVLQIKWQEIDHHYWQWYPSYRQVLITQITALPRTVFAFFFLFRITFTIWFVILAYHDPIFSCCLWNYCLIFVFVLQLSVLILDNLA